MGERVGTAAGAPKAKRGRGNSSPAAGAAAGRADNAAAESGALQTMSAEIVGLLYEQAFGTGVTLDEGEICGTFTNILLRHWDLCCVSTFLRDEGGALRRCADFSHQHLDTDNTCRAVELLAAEMERTGEEYQFWTGDGRAEKAAPGGLRETFERASLKAGAAVPIRAHGELAGALVVASANPERLRAALGGARCIGPAIIIGIGNARRGAAMSEQHRQIESLVGELQQRTSALEEANRELQRVGRYRSLFLARMSHELRTPLTSILGFAEILLDVEDLSDTQRRFCEKIQSSGFQLQASLNQLVDLSRLEAGQTELFLHEFSLRETLRESCAAVARLAQKQGVTLECVTSPDVGALVSDEGKLRQVLYNFLAFAIGRSPSGAGVRVFASPEEGERLRVEIADEGEPLRDAAHLFDPVDVDAPNERGTNMNELGLVIAHRLLGVLGGVVRLEARGAERGLAVHLTLPTRPTEKTVTSDK